MLLIYELKYDKQKKKTEQNILCFVSWLFWVPCTINMLRNYYNVCESILTGFDRIHKKSHYEK